MKKVLSLAMVLVLALAFTAFAGDDATTQKGQILDVNLNQGVVVIMTGKGQMKFHLNPDTNYFAGKAPIQKTALAPKDNVEIEYKEEDGKKIAKKIVVSNFQKKK